VMMKYIPYHINNISKIPQWDKLSSNQKESIQILSRVFPFRTNNYVVDELIDWNNFESDPMFILNFPNEGMLDRGQSQMLQELINNGADDKAISMMVDEIRNDLNPHPAGQVEHNVPELNGEKLLGVQHKYKETVLFFPSQGQTCHAYCTFCFRWPQFVGRNDLKFAMKQSDLLVEYLSKHQNVSDLLITGGDPMFMNAKQLERHIDGILSSKKHNLKSIRIGSKSLSFWPYRFLSDKDSDDLLRVFDKIVAAGLNLSFMAHVNHPRELSTDAVKNAVQRIQNTGAIIRTQSPIIKHINDKPELWIRMWQKQVEMGMVPYYMFIARSV